MVILVTDLMRDYDTRVTHQIESMNALETSLGQLLPVDFKRKVNDLIRKPSLPPDETDELPYIYIGY